MKINNYKQAFKDIKPEDSLGVEIFERINASNNTSKKSTFAFKAVCSAVIIFAVILGSTAAAVINTPGLLAGSTGIDNTNDKNNNYDTDNIYFGLEAKNFVLEENISADRLVYYDLESLANGLFKDSEPSDFIIVRVNNVNKYESVNSDILSDGMIVTANVLTCINGDIQDEINIFQYLHGGCPGEENDNIMRKNGVYILPVVMSSVVSNNYYYVCGDLDVLFEIDNKGFVHSHSRIKEFNKYNNQTYGVLLNDIAKICKK